MFCCQNKNLLCFGREIYNGFRLGWANNFGEGGEGKLLRRETQIYIYIYEKLHFVHS